MDKELALNLIGNKQFAALKSDLQEMNPADLAFLISELDEDEDFSEKQLIMLYRILPKELAAESFTYMDTDTQMKRIPRYTL